MAGEHVQVSPDVELNAIVQEYQRVGQAREMGHCQ